MSKVKKILIVISVVCILLGGAIMTGALVTLQQHASEEIAAMEFHQTTQRITEDFSDIVINTQNSSIEILPSSNGTCRIVCDDHEKIFHTVSLQNTGDGSVLYITQHNEWQWYDIFGGIHWQDDPVLTIYLPKDAYGVVDLFSSSGDITVAPDFSFRTLSTYSVSGNTKLSDLKSDNLNIRSISGDISVHIAEVAEDVYLGNVSGFTRAEHVNSNQLTVNTSSGNTALEYITSAYLHSSAVSGQIIVYDSILQDTSHFETSSGSIEISDSECGEQTIQGISGSVKLQNVRGTSLNARTTSSYIFIGKALYNGNVLCNTSSGGISFAGLDAENLEFFTSSGDVSGNLLSGKNFITETSSGYVSVPPSDETAGICHISTVSGDIHIAIEP